MERLIAGKYYYIININNNEIYAYGKYFGADYIRGEYPFAKFIDLIFYKNGDATQPDDPINNPNYDSFEIVNFKFEADIGNILQN